MAQVVGAPYPGAPQQPPSGPVHRTQPQPTNTRTRQPQQPSAGQPQQQQRRHSSQHARPPGGGGGAAGSRRPAQAGGSGSRQSAGKAGGQAAGKPAVTVPTIAADNMPDLEQLRRVTPFMCNIRFRNNLPEIPSDPKMIMSPYEPERLSKFFLTSVEQQPQRELLLTADVGLPISALDLERYDVPDDLDPRHKLDPQDEALLQDVEGLPTGGGGVSTSIRDVKRSTKGVVSWLMNTTYLTSGGDAGPRRAGPGRFQMGSSQQPEELSREQQLADIEATFTAARNVPRHPTKPGVTAVRCVPILPDVEAWPNKYVVVQFPEGDPATDSRTLAKVKTPEMRRELLSHSMLKSYQTPGSNPNRGTDLTVGLLVPHDLAGTAISGGQLPDELSAEEMAGDYSWDCEYNFDLQQRDTAQPPQQILLMMHDDKLGYCNMDGTLKLRKRKRQPTDGPRPQKAVVEHRGYHENEVAERQDRVAQIDMDPALVMEGDAGMDGAGATAEDVFGADDDGYQEDAEGAEQGGLGYQ